MADKVEQYLQATDNADMYAEHLMLELNQTALEDIDDLMTSADRRDDELWDEMGVDAGLVVSDYEVEPVENRGVDWFNGLAGVAAASQTQFFLDNRQETLIKPVAYREQVLSGIVLTRTELIRAGKRSIEIVAQERYAVLQSRYLKELSYLSDYTATELYGALQELGALKPAGQAIADASGYVFRMTGYRPGSAQFKSEVARLVDSSAQNIKWMNRRAVERLHSYREADGDMNTPMVWIGERSPANCPYCPPNFGVIKKYREWLEDGMPGSDVCAGQDRCQCHLAAA